jgi:hypothetical protein
LKSLKTLSLLIVVLIFSSIASWAKTGTTHKSVSKKSGKATGASSTKKAHTGKRSAKRKVVSKKGAWKHRGQQSIASERATEIQEALVREGYLKTEPSGVLDSATKEALVRYQEDNGWQKKVVPDSRALIKLGLGPDHSNLLNPDTAILPSVSSQASR